MFNYTPALLVAGRASQIGCPFSFVSSAALPGGVTREGRAGQVVKQVLHVTYCSFRSRSHDCGRVTRSELRREAGAEGTAL